MINVKIDTDSIGPSGSRLTTMVMTMPRFLLAELNTHRDFSRNTASSRAIPIRKMVAAVKKNCHVFEQYGAGNTGMSALEVMDFDTIAEFRTDWAEMARKACEFAERWDGRAAKQMVNRVLEPFMFVTALVSATEWENYFIQRAHPDAQPEFQVVAYNALHHYLRSVPEEVRLMKWHTPLLSFTEKHDWDDRTRVIVSTARCARISYTNHEVVKSFDEDYALYKRLIASRHMSPLEHCARALGRREQNGNFIGWIQERKFQTNEHGRGQPSGTLERIMSNKPAHIRIYE